MKRMLSVVTTIVIAVILVSDLGLIVKMHQKPDAYALMEKISFIHFLLLREWGMQFAYTKVAFSLALMLLWFAKVISPTKATALRHVTVIYSFIWTMIGLLILTGIVGTLQYSAGLPIKLYDFSLLIISMEFANLIVLISIVVCLPLTLMIAPTLHNAILDLGSKSIQQESHN